MPFERERLSRKAAELGGQSAGWMAAAKAIGDRLVDAWDAGLESDDQRRLAATAAEPTALWKADRFVSWALVTIGLGLIVGILVKFHAVGGALFLAGVLVTQPFWVAGAQATYNQWTEFAALLVVVVGAFITSDILFMKTLGIGMALAVGLDATVIRALLVPATMRMMGQWNWWAPAPLRRLWLASSDAALPATALPPSDSLLALLAALLVATGAGLGVWWFGRVS